MAMNVQLWIGMISVCCILKEIQFRYYANKALREQLPVTWQRCITVDISLAKNVFFHIFIDDRGHSATLQLQACPAATRQYETFLLK